MQTSNNHYQKIHNFLDQQLNSIKNSAKPEPSFDNIQEKLKKIEDRLLHMKQQSTREAVIHYAVQTSHVRPLASSFLPSQMGSDKKTDKYRSNNKQSVQNNQNVDLLTPAKKIGKSKRVMSANQLSVKGTVKKSKKKAKSTTKKQEMKMQSLTNLFTQQKQTRTTPQKRTRAFNETNSSSAIQLRVLKRQLSQCERSNTQLRHQMNGLKSYERECWKLKDIFDRCEQLRRRSRLLRPRK